MTTLFSPVTYRSLTLKNRVIVAPMCQYSCKHGFATDWHLVHLGRFALGGFSLVIAEATAVTPEGRISYADLGLWDDAQIAPLKRVTEFLHRNGAAAGLQLAVLRLNRQTVRDPGDHGVRLRVAPKDQVLRADVLVRHFAVELRGRDTPEVLPPLHPGPFGFGFRPCVDLC